MRCDRTQTYRSPDRTVIPIRGLSIQHRMFKTPLLIAIQLRNPSRKTKNIGFLQIESLFKEKRIDNYLYLGYCSRSET
jgi:hypothetical protein